MGTLNIRDFRDRRAGLAKFTAIYGNKSQVEEPDTLAHTRQKSLFERIKGASNSFSIADCHNIDFRKILNSFKRTLNVRLGELKTTETQSSQRDGHLFGGGFVFVGQAGDFCPGGD